MLFRCYLSFKVLTMRLMKGSRLVFYLNHNFRCYNSMDMSQFGCLVPPNFTQLIDQWMMEDTPSFDYGGYIVGG